jgi:nucleoside-diphosphate-sugar epimerase
MKRVVVTGATGFIGANLVRRLLDDGHDVWIFVRPGCAGWRIADIRGHVQVHDADLQDEAAVATGLRRIRPDWIFNLAAHGAYSWQTDLRAMLTTNLLGTVHLLEAAVATGFESFVQTGTSSEYGAKDHSPAESEVLEPNSHYAVTKASATLFCRYTGQATGLGVRILRLYSVYGPWEEPDRLMPTLVTRGLAGELPPLVSPETARDYVYVDDAVAAIIAAAATAAQEPGAVYNVGTGRQTSLSEVVEMVRAAMGITAEPAWGTMAPRTWDTDVWIADIGRIQAELRWRPAHSLPEGFGSLAGWLRDRPDIGEWYASFSRPPLESSRR